MTANQVIENATNTMDYFMNMAQKADESVEGIKTVCADVVQVSDTTVSVQFICEDGTQVKPIKQEGQWAGRMLNKLADLWDIPQSERTFKAVQQACADDTREIMLFGRKGVSAEGNPYDMQDFRRPNKIDRGRVNHEIIQAHTSEIVQRDIEYRKLQAQAQARKED